MLTARRVYGAKLSTRFGGSDASKDGRWSDRDARRGGPRCLSNGVATTRRAAGKISRDLRGVRRCDASRHTISSPLLIASRADDRLRHRWAFGDAIVAGRLARSKVVAVMVHRPWRHDKYLYGVRTVGRAVPRGHGGASRASVRPVRDDSSANRAGAGCREGESPVRCPTAANGEHARRDGIRSTSPKIARQASIDARAREAATSV